ncbi:MAG: family oxidoreductase [Hyphomicrobiales bacterium]|nr:family oxidoreductase [Hyphomicrobiales bacterium]
MNLFVFGLGYSSQVFVQDFGARFASVTGTVRSEDKAARLRAEGRVTPLVFADGQREGAVSQALLDADVLLVSTPPDAQGDPVLRAFADDLAAARLQRIVYLSTVGVYGDHQGAWIDEDTAPRPVAGRSNARLAAEDEWRALAARSGVALNILRLSGIYGQGRNALVSLANGTAKRIVKPGQVFNRIHVADIARAIMACIDAGQPGAIYNVTDDEPAPPQDVVAFAADLLGVAPPPEQDYFTASMTPMARSFYGETKRVSNARIKRELGFVFSRPTYREGLRDLLAMGEGR